MQFTYDTLTDIGGRPYMEDVANVMYSSDESGFICITVADGHGGREVADYAVEHLPRACLAKLAEMMAEGSGEKGLYPMHGSARALFEAYKEVDAEILSSKKIEHVGATYCGLLLNPTKQVLLTGNCGDTMAIIATKQGAQWLTAEHKAGLEADFLRSRGARVIDCEGMMRVEGNLNLSRSMGDGYLKRFIICSPEVTRVGLKPFAGVKTFFFVASDGIWDVLDKDQVHAIMVQEGVFDLNPDPRTPARPFAPLLRRLLDISRARGSTDNVAMIVGVLF